MSFDELYDNVMALSEVARVTFVEIPQEAAARKASGTAQVSASMQPTDFNR